MTHEIDGSRTDRFSRRSIRVFSSSLEQPLGSAREFVRYQTGEELDGGHRFCLGLVQTRHGIQTPMPQVRGGTSMYMMYNARLSCFPRRT
jgi:hypothetical protein